ncbi:MAG: hypothetical protein CBC42_06775 [Betaproteobacteria bacterium TMED82]|nr:MAG: hypothetical protein CBC42_06775 [Betaproteobacteria bacterium TMED82]
MFQALWVFLILLILEISLSFDNAVVNASVLKHWDKFWQMLFLTLGILVAVFGMRLLFPLVIVGFTTNLSLVETWNLAIQKPTEYSVILMEHHAQISAFGGIFLLLIFLNFFMTSKKEVLWIPFIERPMEQLGKFQGFPVLITLTLLTLVTSNLDSEERTSILNFGIVGLLTYLAISVLSQALEKKGLDAAEAIKKGSIGGFIYLEVLDASFSIDAVVGAFAITKDIVIIMLGLGAGAMAVRSITIYLVKKKTLNELIFLEHGAHYAIGALAIIMIASVQLHIPEIITGTIGLVLVAAAAISSIKHKK